MLQKCYNKYTNILYKLSIYTRIYTRIYNSLTIVKAQNSIIKLKLLSAANGVLEVLKEKPVVKNIISHKNYYKPSQVITPSNILTTITDWLNDEYCIARVKFSNAQKRTILLMSPDIHPSLRICSKISVARTGR